MARGRVDPPNLDDRTWREIVEQTRALIPRYAPEWTDHNPSDLGIALIELFAWIVESMIYRLNRVPEKNFIEFLNLLGITRDPATPASTFLTYKIAPRSSSPVIIPKGHQVSTPQTEIEEGIVFETDGELTVLPINLTTALSINQTQIEDVTSALVGSPLTGKKITIAANQSILLVLGFDAASTERIELLFRFTEPVKENQININWHYCAGNNTPENWSAITPVNDGTEGMQSNGIISLQVPADWTAQNPENWSEAEIADDLKQPRFWLGIRISNTTAESGTPQAVEIGIRYILFNSVNATNALTISQPELLGVSSGEPFQFFELRYQPLFKQPRVQDPYEHLIIQIREALDNGEFTEWTTWTYQADLPKCAGNHYRLNPVTGTITFGNYHPTISPDGHGTIPRRGSEIRAFTYRYVVGGVQGNVPANSIQVIRMPIGNLTGVTNLGAAIDGADEESIEDTKRRAPEMLRNRYRAVTVEDYEYLAREASTEVKKVRCLAPRQFTEGDRRPTGAEIGDAWSYGGIDRSIGTVNVIIIPQASLSNPNPRPMPSEELLREVSDYLEERRPVTTRLHVTSPRYLPINVITEIKVWQKAFDNGLLQQGDYQQKVRDKILSKISRFLDPIWGGVEGNGWEIGQEINISSLFEVIQPDPEIGFIADLKLAAGQPFYQPTDRPESINQPLVRVPVADYEIICAGTNHQINVERLR
jgi:hypothetical protein